MSKYYRDIEVKAGSSYRGSAIQFPNLEVIRSRSRIAKPFDILCCLIEDYGEFLTDDTAKDDLCLRVGHINMYFSYKKSRSNEFVVYSATINGFLHRLVDSAVDITSVDYRRELEKILRVMVYSEISMLKSFDPSLGYDYLQVPLENIVCPISGRRFGIFDEFCGFLVYSAIHTMIDSNRFGVSSNNFRALIVKDEMYGYMMEVENKNFGENDRDGWSESIVKHCSASIDTMSNIAFETVFSFWFWN